MEQESSTESRPRLRMLAVDDMPSLARTMRRVFRRSFDVTIACSGAEGVALLESQPFDVGLIDYAMPSMNGIEVCRVARAAQPAMVRLLVTGHADLEILAQAVADGDAHAIVAKPWSRGDLIAVIEHHLRVSVPR